MKIKRTTTFKQLHDANACKYRYRHLAKALGGINKYGRTKPINLLSILEHNGLDDFFWALRITEDYQILRAMAADFAESVLPIFERQHPDDGRPRKAIEVARKYAHGEATDEERVAVWGDAYDAAAAAQAWATAASFTGDAAAAQAVAASAWAAARAAAAPPGDVATQASAASAWATGDTASYAARAAAASDAEREKQVKIIKRYLK